MYKPVKTGIVEAPHTNTIHKQSTTQARPCGKKKKKKMAVDFVVFVFFFWRAKSCLLNGLLLMFSE